MALEIATPFNHYRVRRPAHAEFLPAATEHVIAHARRSNARVIAADKRYSVRYPLSASRCFMASDTHDLVTMVAKEMHKRAKS